jgi:hypothetical protein
MQEQQAQMQKPMTSLQNTDFAKTMARMFGGNKPPKAPAVQTIKS